MNTKKTIDTEKSFNLLVNNALDFLKKAISEFSKEPKYSLINFYTAVELVLKARLLKEHWTLILGNTSNVDIKKFEQCDFNSVYLKEADNRLTNIVAEGLTRKQYNSFENVRTHRNIMVHFYHRADNDLTLKKEIAKMQLEAWFHLNYLLTEIWESIFRPFTAQIEKIEKSLKSIKDFLNIVFQEKKNEIDEAKQQGKNIVECPSCNFKSLIFSKDEHDFIHISKCSVCKFEGNHIEIVCPECKKPVIFNNDGYTNCLHCGVGLDYSEIKESFKDILGGPIINCSFCEGADTVVETSPGEYFCLSCFQIFHCIESCDWCGELCTGDMEDSFYSGCGICNGKKGF